MGSRYTWTNEDGLTINSGTRATAENDIASANADVGNVRELKMVVPQGKIAQAGGSSSFGAVIPAGSTIVDVQLHSTGALTGLVDLVVGITDYDGGSDITDADGLVLAIDAAEVVALRPTGTVVGTAFDGALLTASAPLAEAAQITWAATAASAAGDVTILVNYI